MKKTILTYLLITAFICSIYAETEVDDFSPVYEQQADPAISEKGSVNDFHAREISIESGFSTVKNEQQIDFKITSLPCEKNKITRPLNISRSIFEDDFETDKGWTFNGEWERAVPTGAAYYDPTADHTEDPGDKVLGHDVTGLGASPYWYENNIGDHAEWAVSPTIDCSGYSNVILSFWRWLGFDSSVNDHAYIDVSNDNGST